MKDKGHFYISLAKSVIRIGGCVLAAIEGSLVLLCAAFGVAELLGIAEELADKRGD